MTLGILFKSELEDIISKCKGCIITSLGNDYYRYFIYENGVYQDYLLKKRNDNQYDVIYAGN